MIILYPAQVRGAGYAVVAGRPLYVRGQHRRRDLTASAMGAPHLQLQLACSYGGGENEKKTENAMERAEGFKKEGRKMCRPCAPHANSRPALAWCRSRRYSRHDGRPSSVDMAIQT